MWEKIKAWCWHSLTIAWAYLLLVGGFALQNLDQLATVFNDPTITQDVAAWLHADPKALGVYSMIAGAITAVARARSLMKAR